MTRCDDSAGNPVQGWYDIDGFHRYFLPGGILATGWQMIDGAPYYLDVNGQPLTGWQTVDGVKYYFHSDGRMAANESIDGVFLTESGQAVSGWVYQDGGWYYAGPNGFVKNQWVTDGVTRYLGADGRAVTGWYDVNGFHRYFDENGLLVTGWRQIENQMYYLDQNGQPITGWQTLEGTTYYFYADGHMAAGEWVDGKYLAASGALTAGWLYQDGGWYYIGPNGFMKNQWVTDGVTRYLGADGRAVTGWYDVNGFHRYFDENGFLVTGWRQIGYLVYHLDVNGQPITGWQTIDGTTYYFYPDGHMAANEWIDGKYLAASGALTMGWLYQDGGWYYVGSTGFVKNQWVTDGVTRYLGADGRAVTGWYDVNGFHRYFDENGLLVTGWRQIENQMYYLDQNGQPITGWQTLEGTTYYFYADGHMAAGEWVDGKYLAASGALTAGWLYQDGGWYYIGPNGFMKNQWVTDGVTRYLGADGRAVTGWYDVNGFHRYFDENGFLVTGWRQIGYLVYHLDVNGQPITGWHTIDGKMYYFYPDGHMAVSEWVDGKYLSETGALQEMKGIDVSSAQGVIDWNKVKADGVQFAVIRAMYWSNSANNYVMDSMFVQNVMGAKAAGIMVGAYWFSEAFNGTEAWQEVQFIANSSEWNALKNSGVVLDLPFFIDYEDVKWLDKHTTYESRTEAVRTGMDAVEQLLGTKSGFYTSDSYAQNWFNGQQLINEGYNAWIARWSSSAPETDGYMMWQYSNVGHVNGISGNVDLNYCYVDFEFHPVTDYTGGYTTITVYDQNTNKNVTGNITEIIKQIVANEVGSGLGLSGMDRNELYKAQAVAAHSYLVAALNRGETPKVGLKSYSGYAGLSESVELVKNQVLIYNGVVINAVYTACSGSYTNSAANMGWGSYDYLVSVESKYDSQMAGASQYYPKTVTIGIEDYYKNGVRYDGMRSNVIKMVGQQQYNKYANNPELWITEIHTDAYGNIDYAVVCGVKISGGQFYENCWGLYGANLRSWSNYNGSGWTFVSNGNGHGVGMSQYGAAGYIAKEYWNYKQVLEHYYRGAKLV